jgi:hypothetical protein
MTLRSQIWLLVLVFLGAMVLVACDDSSERRSRRGRVTKPTAKSAANKIVEPPPPEESDFDEDLGRTVRETRDPFQPFLRRTEATGDGEGIQNPQLGGGVLATVTADQLDLIATITGVPVHKAMVVDGTRMGHLVRTGDIIGGATDSPMRVAKIGRNELVFQALSQAPDGARREVRKVLEAAAEADLLAP